MKDEKVIEDLMQKVYPDRTPAPKALQYFAATSDFDWGRGPTLDEALDNARFHLKQDWVNIFVGYDLEPGFCGAAAGQIICSFKFNLARYRRAGR